MATVIRTFADPQHAQQLFDRLVVAGLSKDKVRLLHGSRGDGSLRSPGVQEEGQEPGDRGVLSSLGHFFASALGGDSPEDAKGRYSQALQRGETLIAVNAASPTEAGLATAILDGGTPGAGGPTSAQPGGGGRAA